MPDMTNAQKVAEEIARYYCEPAMDGRICGDYEGCPSCRESVHPGIAAIVEKHWGNAEKILLGTAKPPKTVFLTGTPESRPVDVQVEEVGEAVVKDYLTTHLSPGQCIANMVAYDGTDATLPVEGKSILLAGPNIHLQYVRARLRKPWNGIEWESDDYERSGVRIGDRWCYLPEVQA